MSPFKNMANSIADNIGLSKKTYTYAPPMPPSILVDCTNYTIDFANRKFLHAGLDPAQQFNVSILIITSSCFVNLTTDFLKRIYSIMDQILSYFLDTPV